MRDGNDHSGINIEILKVLSSFEQNLIEVHLVTTTANVHLEKLKKFVDSNRWVKLHIDSNEIATLMKRSDFAIVSPSVVLNEVLYMGISFIAIQTADNQQFMVEYLQSNNYPVLKHLDTEMLRKMLQKEWEIA